MAGLAALPKLALVDIIVLVTGIALPRCALVEVVRMAMLTLYVDVGASQG
jgi:hypothetical protein